ncbi:MAG TPA: heme exporter protein CcmD [Gammaproteobacteria bacterium]|nr:heme exporter protein CcmD [Gammaproteobacteria bacterium]
MKSLHEFLTMGGYAAYVWPAYGVTAVVMLVNALQPGLRLKRRLAELKRRAGEGTPP